MECEDQVSWLGKKRKWTENVYQIINNDTKKKKNKPNVDRLCFTKKKPFKCLYVYRRLTLCLMKWKKRVIVYCFKGSELLKQ